MVNGSLLQTSLPLMTARQQENVCSELPVLHLHCLELLISIAKGMGSQLLPHAASMVRIITLYFKTCAFPELRIKVYSITRILLISMGVGMALCLAQEVINNAIIDLIALGNKSGGTLNGSNSNAFTGPLVQPSHRKRKCSSTTATLWKQNEGLRVEAPNNTLMNPISLRIAALEALEALITVAGSLKSEQWRSKVDNLLIVIAVDSFKEGWVREEVAMSQKTLPSATFADLQLAALRALLASFLSISRAPPPYLAQGLELFHRGKQQSGTKLAEFCAHALLALDVLLHPKAVSLADYYENHKKSLDKSHCKFQDDVTDGLKNRTPFSPFGFQPEQHDAPKSNDDLCDEWLENEEPGTPLAGDIEPSEDPSKVVKYYDNPKLLSVHHSSVTRTQDMSEHVPEATCSGVEMSVVGNEMNVMQFQESTWSSFSVAEATCGSVATQIVDERIVSDSSMTHHAGFQIDSGQGASIHGGVELASFSNSLLLAAYTDKNKEFAFEFDIGDAAAEDFFS
ncbi:uncharacterized protein LOC129289400 isoform X2 [Prosopis cineraria]|nr:uncharacterized protein LOC129289400 isoform X2 [Prosopis cineraria]